MTLDESIEFPLPFVQGVVTSSELQSLFKIGYWVGPTDYPTGSPMSEQETVAETHEGSQDGSIKLEKESNPRIQKKSEQIIQGSSYDAVTDDHMFWVPKNFRPIEGMPVRDALCALPKRHNSPISLDHKGTHTERGNAYAIPIQGEFQIPVGYRIHSNPKSTQGRLGNTVRLLFDGVPHFDHVVGPWKGKIYAFFEPDYFSNILYKDLALSQIRVICGRQCRLDDDALMRMVYSNPVLSNNKKLINIPSPEFIDEGLLLTLDLLGETSAGIVGFKSLRTPHPIDQGRRDHDLDTFWEPVLSPRSKELNLDESLYILLAKYDYTIPSDYCAELTEYHSQTGAVQLHRAGFFDPQFTGRPVLEVIRIQQDKQVTLPHGLPVGKLIFYYCRLSPSVGYGSVHGNNYAGQTGPQVSKHFGRLSPEDYAAIAKAR